MGCQALTDIDVQSEIEAVAADTVARLAAELGGEVRTSRKSRSGVVTLVIGGAFVEVELDWRERAVFALTGLTGPRGELPDGYYVDSTGAKVRWQLAAVLAKSEDAEVRRVVAVLRSAQKLSGPDAMRRQLAAIEAAVRAAGDTLPELVRTTPHSGGHQDGPARQ